MNSNLVVDELVDYALTKCADDDEFSTDPTAQSKKDRAHKLKLALIGLGALGAGGAAAWALSGDAGKSIGKSIGGFFGSGEKPFAAALNPLTHGLAAGGYMMAQRSGWAGKVLGDTAPSGAIRGAQLPTTRPTVAQRTGANLSDAGVSPANTPDRIAEDLKRLTAPSGEASIKDRWLTLYPATDAARAPFAEFMDYTKTGPTKAPEAPVAPKAPKAPVGKNGAPPSQETVANHRADMLKFDQELAAYKRGLIDYGQAKPLAQALAAPVDPIKLQTAFSEFNRPNAPAPMHASASGLYIRQGSRYVPLSAVDMPLDQILRSQDLVQHYVDKDGVAKIEKVDLNTKPVTAPPSLADQIYHTAKTTRKGSYLTPAGEVNLFLLKQQTAPKQLERLAQLGGLLKTNPGDPAATRLRELLHGDVMNTFNTSRYAETGAIPDKIGTATMESVVHRLSPRVQSGANAYHALGRSLHNVRNQSGTGAALRRGGIAALVTTLLSGGVQHGLDIGAGSDD